MCQRTRHRTLDYKERVAGESGCRADSLRDRRQLESGGEDRRYASESTAPDASTATRRGDTISWQPQYALQSSRRSWRLVKLTDAIAVHSFALPVASHVQSRPLQIMRKARAMQAVVRSGLVCSRPIVSSRAIAYTAACYANFGIARSSHLR